jgi:hypothetical protein
VNQPRKSNILVILCIVCICSLRILCNALAAPKDEGDKLILAGERIGHAQLEMDGAKLDELLGEPTTGDQAMSRISETWCSKSTDGEIQQLIVYLHAADENRKHWAVTEAVVTSHFFHTPAGVTVLSEPAAIWREFPDLQYVDTAKTKDGVSVELYASAANGIGFVIERNAQPAQGQTWGRCHALVVFKRGQMIGVPYLGDCEPVR